MAMLTHTRYGMSRLPAAGETLNEATIVASIISHRILMIATAAPLAFRPKKTADQSAFNPSYTQNSTKASSTAPLFSPSSQTKNTEMPMNR